MKQTKKWAFMLLVIAIAVLTACGGNGNNQGSNNNQADEHSGHQEEELKSVKVVLDWTPNTNHTGLYVARDNGYYKEQGLDVEIIMPGDAGADAMVASGNAEFGVSYQEGVTQARTAKDQVPLVSIAAVIQHNTSGFASPKEKKIVSPKDFENKTYGGWGSPVEQAVIESLMQADNADPSKVNIVSIGDADYFTAVKRDIDFAWIYYAWTGIEAELRNEPMNMIYLTDISDKLDYYTPVLVTNEKMIEKDPELVRDFLAATAKGYQFAIDNPEEAANLLVKANPDLNKELVVASQKWLSPKYTDDAPRWGEQKREVWQNYAQWMLDHKLLERELDVDKAFTNEFLPEGQ